MSESVILDEREMPCTKKPYETPRLIIHGDVESITLGDDLGESMDASFTTDIIGKKKRKKPKFS